MVTKVQRDSIQRDIEQEKFGDAITKLEASIALELDDKNKTELKHAIEHLDGAITDPGSLQKDRALRALSNVVI